MLIAVQTIWPLMIGFFCVMLAQGLHSTLIGIRAGIEGFDPSTVGIVISFYTAGVFFGTYIVSGLIRRVGHIRAYALACTVASCAMLGYILWIEPVVWALSRFAIGLSMALIYSITESWLNDSASNENRGAFVSLYVVVTNFGAGCGQFLLLLAPPENADPFMMLSILFSLSVIPILLTVRNVPSVESPVRMTILELYRITPFGMVNMLLAGAIYGGMFVMGGIYANLAGFSLLDISMFVSVMVFMPAISQTPIGRLSDRFDRRWVIIPLLVASVALLSVHGFVTRMPSLQQTIYIGLLSAFMVPLHGLVIAHTNDFLDRKQMVSAATALLRLFSIGSLLASLILGYTMQWVGPKGYFLFLLAAAVIMLVYSLVRVGLRPGKMVTARSDYQTMPTRAGLDVGQMLADEPRKDYAGDEEDSIE